MLYPDCQSGIENQKRRISEKAKSSQSDEASLSLFRRDYSRGFTLIELLVVVAIISLLVSVLVPTLSMAKDLAKSAVCATKHSELTKAWTMYANDNNGVIMLCYHGWEYSGVDVPDDWEEKTWWVNLICPYVGINSGNGGINEDDTESDWAQSFWCPASEPFEGIATIGAHGMTSTPWIGMNERLDPFTYWYQSLSSTPLHLGDIPRISDTVVFTDCRSSAYMWRWGADHFRNSFTYRHIKANYSNFAMVDGHVESAKTRTPYDMHPAEGYDDAIPPEQYIYLPNSSWEGFPRWYYDDYK